jgi:predicted PurR-regulated permease PerM
MQPPVTERIYLSSRARSAILWIVVGLTLLFLWQVRSILTPFLWAVVTAYVLNPVAVFLARRTGLSRRVWAVVFYLGLLGLLAWGLSSLVPLISQQLNDLSRELPRHFREAGKLIGQSEIELLGVRINLNAPDDEIRRQVGRLLSNLSQDIIPEAIPHVAESLLKLLVYLVASFFLLLDADRIGELISRFTPPGARAELGPWVRRINHVLGAYIRGQLILVALMSTVTYIALSILQVRFAPLLAIFTGLVETIPFIGPYTAGSTAVLVALTQGHAPFGWTPLVLGVVVAIVYTVLRQLEDNFVMPFLIGRLVHLHPLTVIFAVLSGAALGGILGLLLAVPIAATVKIIASYLYYKFREEPPRTLVLVEPDDDWEAIAVRVREGVLVSRAEGASRPRLLISVPYPPPAMLDPAQFHRLPALVQESAADALLLTTNEALAALAAEAGMAVTAGPATEAPATVPEPPVEEIEVKLPTLLNRRKDPRAQAGQGQAQMPSVSGGPEPAAPGTGAQAWADESEPGRRHDRSL